MKTNYLLILTALLPLATRANTSEPSSALAFQQTTNTSIVVEENHLRFFTGGSERMTIDADGNVGIGGITSAALLHLQTTGNQKGLRLFNSTNNAQFNFWTTESNGIKQLRISEDTEGKTVMTLLQNGKVGVGTNSPTQKLSIIDGDMYIGRSTVNQSESGLIRLTEHLGSYQGGYIRYDGASNILHVGVHHNNNGLLSDDFHSISINRSNGKVGIGTTSSSYRLEVNGVAYATEFRAPSNQTWPDYVFEDTYELNELDQVEKYIEENHHLPEIPSAADVAANGVDIVDMQAKLLQKVEELTLYVIDLKKESESQQKEIEKLKSQKPKANR